MNSTKKSDKKESKTKLKLSLKAEERKIFGRKVKKLRHENILPANLYGKDIKSQALKVDQKNFLSIYNQAGETSIVELLVGNKKSPYSVLIHNVQLDPVADSPLHVDFHKVDLTKKVQVNIPIELIGEAPGVSKGGILVQIMNEVEVEALPAELPDKFEVDISSLKEIGNSLTVKDLKYNKDKVKLLIENEEQSVVNLEAPQEEEEEVPPAEAEAAEAETGVTTEAEAEEKEEQTEKAEKAFEEKKTQEDQQEKGKKK